MRSEATSRDGTRIAYEARGAGSPAVVFVHGWSCDRGYWDAQRDTLSVDALVVAIDLAGHGESGATREAWTIEAFGDDVAAVVKGAGIDDAILVGHSMGADVVLEASCQLKGVARGLVWVDEHRQLTWFRSEKDVSDRLAPFRADFAAATEAFVRGMFPASSEPSLVDHVVRQISSAPKEIALPALEATWNYARNVPARLAAMRLPVVAINAEGSNTDIESMRRCGVEVLLMPEVGHFPMLEDPPAFNACLTRAIKAFRRCPP